MAGQALITRRDLSRALLLWACLILIAAAANVPWAVTRWRSRRAPIPPGASRLMGAAAARPWPSSTPHDTPWPAPTDWSEYREFGHRHYNVRRASAEPAKNGFSMDVHQYGWPLPVVEDKQMWWDWNDPALTGPESDPRPRIMPAGLLANPLILGTAAFLILAGPFIAFALARRAWRRQGNQCVRCGYPIGVSGVCTECGSPVGASAHR